MIFEHDFSPLFNPIRYLKGIKPSRICLSKDCEGSCLSQESELCGYCVYFKHSTASPYSITETHGLLVSFNHSDIYV